MEVFNSNNIQKANSILDSMDGDASVKIIKKERGLMERSEVENKVILAEDNRQVIFG